MNLPRIDRMPLGKAVILLLGAMSAGRCEGSSRLAVCSRKWVKMNDRNYERALDHYVECARLADRLQPPVKAQYQRNIIANMKRTCNYFFDRSGLPLSSLIGVLREVAKILENLDEGIISQPKSQRFRSCQNYNLSDATTCRICINETKVNTNGCMYSNNGQSTKLILWALFWLVVFTVIIQMLFALWLFCISACMGFNAETGGRKFPEGTTHRDGGGTRQSVTHYDSAKIPGLDRGSESQFKTEPELTSLSSDNIGSDIEFEAMMAHRKLPKSQKLPKQQEYSSTNLTS